MSLKYLEFLSKSMQKTEWKPELLPNLLEELRFFFQTLRVKLESDDPAMRESAAEEIKELRVLLEGHPLLRSALPNGS